MYSMHDLAGSLFWALALSIIIYIGGSIAMGLLSKKRTSSGETAVVATLGPENLFGEMSLLTGGAHGQHPHEGGC